MNVVCALYVIHRENVPVCKFCPALNTNQLRCIIVQVAVIVG